MTSQPRKLTGDTVIELVIVWHRGEMVGVLLLLLLLVVTAGAWWAIIAGRTIMIATFTCRTRVHNGDSAVARLERSFTCT